MPRSRQKSAPSQVALAIRDHLDRAKTNIEAGESHMHQAANDVAAAYKLGATQADIAEAVGKSQPWVSGLLKWRDSGWADTPFGPKSKAARARRTDYQATNNSDDAADDAAPTTTDDMTEVGHNKLKLAHLQTIMDIPQDDQFWRYVGPMYLSEFIAKLRAIYAAQEAEYNALNAKDVSAIKESAASVEKVA
jgi:hypothetical protein